MLRAQYHESMNKGRGGDRNPDGNNQHTENRSKSTNRTLTSDTASEVAKKTGVSRTTITEDVRLMKALDKLGIPRADYAAAMMGLTWACASFSLILLCKTASANSGAAFATCFAMST
jgi:hypothetical protein